MQITLTAAPFRRYTATDIFTLEGISHRAQRVLWRVQELDASGKGEHGCFATVASLAEDLKMTPGAVRNYISRLHQQGYIAFIGTRGRGVKRLVCRRVTLFHEPASVRRPGVETFMAEKFLAGEQDLSAAPAHMTIVDIGQADVPTVEEFRAGRPFFGPQDETVSSHVTSESETHSLKEKNKEGIPPSAGCPSSNLSSQTSKPSIGGSEITHTHPAPEGSHKKKDWVALLQQQPFFNILKTRFPGFSLSDAKKVMGLVVRRGIPAVVVGYALEHLVRLSKMPDFGKPARPMTLAAFCKNFDKNLEEIVLQVKDHVEIDYIAELNEFETLGDGCVGLSRQQFERKINEGMRLEEWSQKREYRSYDIWPDMFWIQKLFGLSGDLMISALPEESQVRFHDRLGIYADIALRYCQHYGFEFEMLFATTYEAAKARGLAIKKRLQDEFRARTEPAMWQPNALAA
jgi:hypothetical protein